MAGKFGYGTKFSATISAVLTEIASLTSIKGVELTADDVDVTAQDSTDGYREFVQGLRDGGTVEIEGNYTSVVSQDGLKALFDLGTLSACTIAFPDGAGGTLATWGFNAYVNKFGTDGPMDDKIGFTASLKVSGKPTLT